MTRTSTTLALVPGTHHAPGTGASTGAEQPRHDHATDAITTAIRRAAQSDYFDWLDHIWPAAGCAHPIRLHGDMHIIDRATGEIIRTSRTSDMPDRIIYKSCGNRRTSACPSCAETYRRDAYHIIRSGLIGGKGIPDKVARHPAVFATFTAPAWGAVHARVVRQHLCTDQARCRCRPEPCHARRDAKSCEHGNSDACFSRHDQADERIGQPLCLDCYDYASHVVWNNTAGELWRRTKQVIERRLNHQARTRRLTRVRVSHGKAAEFQRRGAVHFHVLLRLDGYDKNSPEDLITPPGGITAADFDEAVKYAARVTQFTTAGHDAKPGGWNIGWGQEIDVRVITMRGDNPVTDAMVAAYLAKYSTKSTEVTGHASRRITPDTIEIYADPDGNHCERLVDACWEIGRHHDYHSLRRWAHMLGFGGHFLTKARRYSVTFRALRDARQLYRRIEITGPEYGPIRTSDQADQETTLILGNLWYVGSGWKTTGDALLANTAADLARRRREAMREDLAHEAADQSGQHASRAA